MDERLTAEEAAKLAGLNVKTFERYVACGKLPITRYRATRQSTPFYSKVDIEKHLEETKLKTA